MLSIDLHSSKSTIRLSFHFQNVAYESLGTTYIVQSSVPGVNIGCPVVMAAAIPGAMLLPTDKCFAREVPEPVYDGPNMLYGIQIRAHGWPMNRSHGFALEVGGYCS